MTEKPTPRRRKSPAKQSVTVLEAHSIPPSPLEASLANEGPGERGGVLVPYDENLLERARTQWQFGDWQSLAQLDRDTLQHHPDRAKLALLAAAGRLQTDKIDEARQYIRMAKDWGISKKLLTRILAAGVHNSLGRAAALSGQHQRALRHFEASISVGTPGSEVRLLTQARVIEQSNQVGLPELARSTLRSYESIHMKELNNDEPAA